MVVVVVVVVVVVGSGTENYCNTFETCLECTSKGCVSDKKPEGSCNVSLQPCSIPPGDIPLPATMTTRSITFLLGVSN